MALVSLAAEAQSALRVTRAEIVLRLALDGSMLVHEHVESRADEAHGSLYRDIPRHGAGGESASLELEIMNVARGGQILPWQSEPAGDYLRVYLGSPARRIPAGSRVYELLYHVDRQLAVDGEREWLLWRPLGPGMRVAVDRVDLTVTFPRPLPAASVRVIAANPPAPSRGAPATQRIDRDGTVHLSWEQTLAPGAGPAVLVSWPRGYLRPETDSEREPWLRPGGEALWWALIGPPLLVGAWWYRPRASRAAARTAVLTATAAAIGSLYAAGRWSTIDPAAFPFELGLVLAAVAFLYTARHWLDAPRYRIAYATLGFVMVAVAVHRLVHSVSAWYPVLVLFNLDAAWLAWRLSARAGERRVRAPRPGTRRVISGTSREPVLDPGDEATESGNPPRRRAPRFGDAESERRPAREPMF